MKIDVVRRGAVVGERHGERIERIGREPDQEAERDQPDAGAVSRLSATSQAAPAIIAAAMTSRRSTRSESAPTGKTPSAEPTHDRRGEQRRVVRRSCRSRRQRPDRAQTSAPFAAPAPRSRKARRAAQRGSSQSRRGRTLRGCAGGSTLVIAMGTIASASSAAGDGERAETRRAPAAAAPSARPPTRRNWRSGRARRARRDWSCVALALIQASITA